MSKMWMMVMRSIRTKKRHDFCTYFNEIINISELERNITSLQAISGRIHYGYYQVGLVLALALSIMRVLLFVARPKTFMLGNVPDSMAYRSMEQYTDASNIPGILILEIDAPIYFANSNYLRERIARWIDEEEDRVKAAGENSLQYVILNMAAVGNIDTSGISMLDEVKKIIDRRGLKLVLANPGSEVMKKMDKSDLIEKIGREWIHLTVGEAVGACNFMLHSTKSDLVKEKSGSWDKV